MDRVAHGAQPGDGGRRNGHRAARARHGPLARRRAARPAARLADAADGRGAASRAGLNAAPPDPPGRPRRNPRYRWPMAAASVTFQDLNRPLSEVARGLYAWERDEPLEAVLQTLAASAGELHARDYTLWVWAGRTARGERAWVLPVSVENAIAFWPKGPAGALARCLGAAVLGEADPHTIRLEDWRGYTCLVAPDMDE